MPLDPRQIIEARRGESSNIVSGGGIVSDALPYLEFGGRLVGQSGGMKITGQSSGFGGQFIGLKPADVRESIYGEQVKSAIDQLITQKKGEGYSVQSSNRLIKNLGGGYQSIIDIDPRSGAFAESQYFQQQQTADPKSQMQLVSDILNNPDIIKSERGTSLLKGMLSEKNPLVDKEYNLGTKATSTFGKIVAAPTPKKETVVQKATSGIKTDLSNIATNIISSPGYKKLTPAQKATQPTSEKLSNIAKNVISRDSKSKPRMLFKRGFKW